MKKLKSEIKNIVDNGYTMRYCFMQIEALMSKTEERGEFYEAVKLIIDKGSVTYRAAFIEIEKLIADESLPRCCQCETTENLTTACEYTGGYTICHACNAAMERELS